MSSTPRGLGVPSAGRRLGKYELLSRLGVGGMGEVFVARESGIAGVKRLVAVKVLLPELAEDPESVESFIDEARIASLLAHPNIVQTYDFDCEDGVYFLAMEYVAGANLARLCERAARRGTGFSRNIATHVVAEMARGLDVAHRAVDAHGKPLQIVHRDISPHNVLVSRHGDVKLMDFGIAHASVRRQRTQTGVVRGKFAYMSPEQIETGKVDPRSDVYSAGIVLWETTLMRRLFGGRTDLETIQLAGAAEIPSPRSVDPSYSSDLDNVVMTALARDPEARFQTAAALSSSLRDVLSDSDPVQKSELAKIVCALFPETDPAMLDLDAVRRMTAQVIATPSHPAPIESPAEVPTVQDSPTPRRWPMWAAIAAMGVIGAVIAGVIVAGTGPGAESANNDLDASSVDATPAVADDSAARDAAATEPAVALDTRTDAAPATTRRNRREEPRERPKPDAAPRPAAVADPPGDDPGAKAPVIDEPLPAAPQGQIAVASNPYGKVSVNGSSFGYTNLLEPLPPGTYSIEVKLSDGSGTYSTTAWIVANKKTKCQVTNKELSCGSPR